MNQEKITIVAYYFGNKLGAGVFMENLHPLLMRKLQKEGYKITLVTNSFFLRDVKKLLPDGIDIVTPKYLEKPIFSKVYFLSVFGNTSYVKKAKYVLFSIDSIVGWRMNNVVSIIHDLNEFEMENKLGKFRTWFRKKMIENTVLKAKKIIVISFFVKQQVERYVFNCLKNKEINVIHSGIPLPSSDFVPDAHREPYFIVVGRIDPKAKYLYEAVQVFLSYQKKHPDFHLKIVGGVNDFCKNEADIFLQYIRTIDGIDFLGYISNEELISLYEKATATIFLSKLEGFGFPLLESFSRGCAVITNESNKVNDEFSSGKAIKIHENEFDNEEIINKKIDLINNIDRVELVEIARKFSWDSAVDKYYHLLND